MKYLITGGAGFIGTHLANNLAKDKANQIIIIDNFHRNVKKIPKGSNIKIIKKDIRSYESFRKIKGVDTVYHLAAQSRVMDCVTDPKYSFQTNVTGTINVLNFSKEKNVDKFIFASSREVYGNPKTLPVSENHKIEPINLYGSLKAFGEKLCQSFEKEFDMNILRLANVYGTLDSERVIPEFISNLKKENEIVVYGGNQILDFVWIEDVIIAMTEIPNSKKLTNKKINIGTGVGTTIKELAKKLKKYTRSKSKITVKEKRKLEVNKYISKSKFYNPKYLNLDTGLKKLLKMDKL